MDTREAYEAIQKAVKADPRKSVVGSSYDEEVFGNFWVTYVQGGERLSVVNDRGQLILYEGSEADHFRKMLLDDLYGADEQAILASISG